MSTMSEDLVEVVARAHWHGLGCTSTLDEIDPRAREVWLNAARAAISAINASGTYKVVPVVTPTPPPRQPE